MALTKKQNQSLNRYEQLRKNVLEDISKIFQEYLIEPHSFYFYEIFFFDDISIQNYIVGTHRAAIHNALNDPYYYLQVRHFKGTNIYSRTLTFCFNLFQIMGNKINLLEF